MPLGQPLKKENEMRINRRFTIPATAATIVIAAFSPAAQARPNANPVTEGPAPVVLQAAAPQPSDSGFNWGDAGIGAAVAAAAAGFAVGTSRRRRSPQPMAG
jgi:hypothetical protein